MDEIAGPVTITFRDDNEAQKLLVEDELLFIARYPDIARQLMTMTPLDYLSE